MEVVSRERTRSPRVVDAVSGLVVLLLPAVLLDHFFPPDLPAGKLSFFPAFLPAHGLLAERLLVRPHRPHRLQTLIFKCARVQSPRMQKSKSAVLREHARARDSRLLSC